MMPFHTLKGQLKTALKNGGFTLAIGGFDISMNEHEAGLFPNHWKPHAWLFVPDAEFVFGGQRLRSHFPKNKQTVPKPILADKWDGDLRAIAYALKGNFHRRITLARKTSHEGGKKRRNVRYRDLRANQKVELLIALDRIGLHRRLFLHGAELVNENGDVKISKA